MSQTYRQTHGHRDSMTESAQWADSVIIQNSDLILKIISKKINAIILVLLFKEISIRPELSSPPHFRIQGGYRERDKVRSPNGNPCV